MKPYKITAKDKPQGFDIRWRLSNAFAWIATKIKPDNPEVAAYVVERVFEAHMETILYGEATTCPSCMGVIRRDRDLPGGWE